MIRIFRVFIPTSVVTLLLSEIVLVLLAFLIAVYLVLPAEFDTFLLYDDGLVRILGIVLVISLTLYYQDMYAELRVRSKVLLLQRLLFTTGIVLIIEAMLIYVVPGLMLPRDVMVFGCGIALVGLFGWRLVYARGVLKALGVRRILFLGSNAACVGAAERILHSPQLGFMSVGFVDDRLAPGADLAGTSVLGPISQLREIVSASNPDSIVVGMAERRNNMPVADLLDLRFQGIRIQEAAALYETVFGRVPVAELRPSQLIYMTELGPEPGNMRIQLMYSIAIASVALLISLPVMLLVAIAVRLTSPGPILFRQSRVGLNGRPFTLYKFRSMVADAEAKTGAVWAQRNDPRVTVIGGYLRKLRLDELPQLINVIRGEMSIVGPRPERPEFVNVLSEQIPFYRQRHCVRPGITGWAQINYKYGDTIQDTIVKLEYDLYYIKNLAPPLDFYIMFQTAKVMLFTRSGQ